MNLDIFKNIPSYQKAVMFILILLIIIGGFFYLIYFPKNTRIEALGDEIASFNKEIIVNKTKLRRLDELKAENEVLQRRLIELKDQLPTETDASALLKQVSELGIQTGLDFKSWKPGAKKQNSSGLYMEMPAAVEVDGSYHSLGIFFDRIRKLSRIINITGLNMEKPKIVRNKIHVQATFTTTAFSVVEGAAKKDEQKKDESKKAQKQPPAQPKKK